MLRCLFQSPKLSQVCLKAIFALLPRRGRSCYLAKPLRLNSVRGKNLGFLRELSSNSYRQLKPKPL